MLYLLEVTYSPENRNEIMERRVSWGFSEGVTAYERLFVIGQDRMIVIADVLDVKSVNRTNGTIYGHMRISQSSASALWQDGKM